MQLSMDMMELSGLDHLALLSKIMPLNSLRKMAQRRKSMLTNLRQPLKQARETGNHVKLVLE